jgi:RNA polymerase sigma-70 factor (ECF subfamily)
MEIPLKLVANYLDALRAIAWSEMDVKGDLGPGKSRTVSDVVLSVFAEFWKDKGEEGVITYAEFKMAVHHYLIDKQRRRKAQKRPQFDPAITSEAISERTGNRGQWILPSEFQQAIERILEDLPPQAAEAFRLRHLEDRSVKETADRLDISEATVKRRVSQVLEVLRSELSD